MKGIRAKERKVRGALGSTSRLKAKERTKTKRTSEQKRSLLWGGGEQKEVNEKKGDP